MKSNWISKRALILTILAALLLSLVVFSVTIGSVKVSFDSIIAMIKGKNVDNASKIIILKLRLPRIVMAVITGGTLSIVGVSLQALFRNPLADPYIIGISSGAALGATSTFFLQRIMGKFFVFYLPFFSFFGAFITMLLVYRLSLLGKRVVIENLLLSGVIIGFIASALITLIIAFAGREVHDILFWLMGDLSHVKWENIWFILGPIIIGVYLLLHFSAELNAISLGEEVAFNLGIDPERLKKIVFFIASFLIGLIVSFSGIIGFVGLVIPHIIRLAVGADHKIVMPASILAGSIFLLLCDDIARTVIAPSELPIGVITSLIGAPLFIYLLKKVGYNG